MTFIAVMPANVSGAVIHSRSGLTFGSVISNKQMKIELMLELFGCLMTYLDQRRITTLMYKAVPHIYHTLPAEEDLYALFRHGAKRLLAHSNPKWRTRTLTSAWLSEGVCLPLGRRRRLRKWLLA
jgi:hypothetical protein